MPTTITNDQYGLYDIEMEPNARGPKLHYHKLMDESFIVREGTLTVLTANGETKVEPMLGENPNDLKGFNELYLENDSYALNEKDMIPLHK